MFLPIGKWLVGPELLYLMSWVHFLKTAKDHFPSWLLLCLWQPELEKKQQTRKAKIPPKTKNSLHEVLGSSYNCYKIQLTGMDTGVRGSEVYSIWGAPFIRNNSKFLMQKCRQAPGRALATHCKGLEGLLNVTRYIITLCLPALIFATSTEHYYLFTF